MKNKFQILVLGILFVFSVVACGGPKSFTASKSYAENDDIEMSDDVDEAVNAMKTADAAIVDEEPMQEQDNASNSKVVDINFDESEDIRQIYKPINDCASSRLIVGDTVYVSYGGSPNAIRSEPDVHPSDNILYRAIQGEQLRVVGGPACSYGWILWKVKTTGGVVGWTPESDGTGFWLVPIIEPRELPQNISSDPVLYNIYKEVEDVMSDKSLSNSEKQNQLRITQNKYGEEVVSYIIRWVPVYNTDRGTFESFDSVMRGFASDYGDSSSSAPIESDPVGAGIRIFFDPSPETITNMLGLSDLGLGGGEEPSPMKTGQEPTEKPVIVPTKIPTKAPTKIPTRVPTSPPAYMTIVYSNTCDQTIWTAVHYLDLDGNWVTQGAWELAPGETANVAHTQNLIFYIYGQTRNAELRWMGNQNLSLRGETYPFQKVQADQLYSFNTVPFQCP